MKLQEAPNWLLSSFLHSVSHFGRSIWQNISSLATHNARRDMVYYNAVCTIHNSRQICARRLTRPITSHRQMCIIYSSWMTFCSWHVGYAMSAALGSGSPDGEPIHWKGSTIDFNTKSVSVPEGDQSYSCQGSTVASLEEDVAQVKADFCPCMPMIIFVFSSFTWFFHAMKLERKKRVL